MGRQDLTLGKHHPVGEALVDFQRELKILTRFGVVMAIVGKNEEAVALEAIAKHIEMILRQADSAVWRIDWRDKAQSIIELAAELKLGLQSVMFLDNNHAERDRVRQALPEVLVAEWPVDQRLYPHGMKWWSRPPYDGATETTAGRSDSSRTNFNSNIHSPQVCECYLTRRVLAATETRS